MGFEIRILESDASIRKKVEEALLEEMNPILLKAVTRIEKAIPPKINEIFENTNTYEAILNGPLRNELGIPAGENMSRLKAIINELASQIIVEFKPIKRRGTNWTGGYNIFIFQRDFRKVLSLPESNINTPNGNLPWLKWLLIEGDRIIIDGYVVKPGNFKASRSGGAIMTKPGRDPIKSWTSTPSTGWSVPKEHSGVRDANWITRSIDENIEMLKDLISVATREAIEENI